VEDGEPVCERLDLLKVPVDIVRPDRLEDVISGLLAESGGKNIVLLSRHDLMRARRAGDYRNYVMNASLVLPVSVSLVRGAKFLRGKTPERYMPFDFIVSLLSILEKRELSVYLLGGQPSVLEKTEKRIRATFPGLRIIGRFPAGFRKEYEAPIVQVIRKSAPALLLVNRGIRGGERWIASHNADLNRGLRLWASDIFDVFSGRRNRVSRFVFDKGLESLVLCLRNPLRIFRFFSFLYYGLLLLVHKLRQK